MTPWRVPFETGAMNPITKGTNGKWTSWRILFEAGVVVALHGGGRRPFHRPFLNFSGLY